MGESEPEEAQPKVIDGDARAVTVHRDLYGNISLEIDGKTYLICYSYGRVFACTGSEECNPSAEDCRNLSRCFEVLAEIKEAARATWLAWDRAAFIERIMRRTLL